MRLSEPERLVLDFWDTSFAGRSRTIAVNSDAVSRVRMALFQVAPPVTRVVLDLTSPESYEVRTLGNMTTVVLRTQADVQVGAEQKNGEKVARLQMAAPTTLLYTVLKNGQLAVSARNSTLADILSAIAARTGAQLEMPAHLHEEKTTVTLDAAPPAEVLAKLLRRFPYGFLVVGATKSGRIDRVIVVDDEPGKSTTVGSGVDTNAQLQGTVAAPTAILAVDSNGTGSGSFNTSQPGGNCGRSCVLRYDTGTTVTLTAEPDPGSIFVSWDGCQSRDGLKCTVTLHSDTNLLATFSVSTVQ